MNELKQDTDFPLWQKIAGIIFGIIFISVILVIILLIPNPTPEQFFVFRIILALAGGGISFLISGKIGVKGNMSKLAVGAVGGFAVFIIISFAPVFVNKEKNKEEKMQKVESKITQNVGEGGTGVIHTGDGDVVIGGKKE